MVGSEDVAGQPRADGWTGWLGRRVCVYMYQILDQILCAGLLHAGLCIRGGLRRLVVRRTRPRNYAKIAHKQNKTNKTQDREARHTELNAKVKASG